MLIPCLVISSILVFGIFGVHTFAGVAIFGALYGFWSGSCQCCRHLLGNVMHPCSSDMSDT